MHDHICKKWSSVPALSHRLGLLFIDPSGRRGEDLFAAPNQQIHVSLCSDLARTMSVQVDNMLVFQLHYRLRSVGGDVPFAASVDFPSPVTNGVPLPITEIGSSALTPFVPPSAPDGGLLLSRPMTVAAAAPSEQAQLCPAPASSLEISDDTIACMMQACASTQTQFSAVSNAPNTRPNEKPDHPAAAEARSCDASAAAQGTGDFTEVFTGRGHSPAAFAAFESALETVKATMGRMDARETVAPVAQRPSASAAASLVSFAGVSAACGQPAAMAKEVEMSIHESTMHHMLSTFGDNSTFHAAPEGEPQDISVKAVDQGPTVNAPAAEPVTGALNNVETTQESEGDSARRQVQAPAGPHAKVADAILRNIERKRKLVAIDNNSERDVRRRRMRRITPTYMGPLSESHRFIVGHFPAS